MKRTSTQCPNGHGAMKRCHIKLSKEGKQVWKAIGWQYCPECKMMLPDKRDSPAA
jgi:hypothetical protein